MNCLISLILDFLAHCKKCVDKSNQIKVNRLFRQTRGEPIAEMWSRDVCGDNI